MANPEHVEMLKRGVDIWNRWRKDNPHVLPALSRTNLSEAKSSWANFPHEDLWEPYLRRTEHSEEYFYRADLSGAFLQVANLSEAELLGANLRGAILAEANLSWANLSGSNLTGARLSGANLSGSNLSGTNLSKARLSGANLSGSNLSGANLSGAGLYGSNLSGSDLSDTNLQFATFHNTLLVDIDLRKVQNIEELRHDGPSYIDISTIIRSVGYIPKSFLRGCGIPDNFIEYMSTLTTQAFQYYSCFISYSSKDQDFAEQLHADLQNKGVRCWYAPKDMKIGDKIRDQIEQSIQTHDKLLLVLSEHSINSEWVEDEGDSAYEQEQSRGTTVLFPIRLDDAVMETKKAWAAKLRRSRHIGDFTNWKDHDSYQNAIDRLLKDLKTERA